ncbi:MAG: DNA repair protein RadC [Armatimonadetes bacterium]|nr:DNA repair protein RadC [Armatimonadota bacterium]
MTPSPRSTLKDLPEELRPRERLMRAGAGALSTAELIAILLRVGTARVTAVHLAAELLVRFGSLQGLAEASVQELGAVKGIGPAKAVQVLAAFELGRRLHTAAPRARHVVRTPADIAALLMPGMRYLDRERFCAVLLDTRHQVIDVVVVSLGSLNATTVHPREVLKEAIRRSAAALVLVHNHPSGDPEPSRDDVRVTERLRAAGEVVGIEVLDHVILGDGRHASLRERGLGFSPADPGAQGPVREGPPHGQARRRGGGPRPRGPEPGARG